MLRSLVGSEMCIRDSYRTERPRPGVSGQGYFRPERPRPGVPGTGHYRPERPRPGVPGRGHYRPERPRPRAPGRGHFRPRFPARLPTGWHRRLLIFLLNTPQIMWCCFGSPVLFFAVVAFVVCGRRRVMFLHGAVHDGRKGQDFIDHRAVELKMSPDSSAHKRIDRGVRNIDSAAWDRETKCRHIWQLRQIHAESRHETSHFEHWQYTVGRSQPSGPRVGHWSPGG